MSRTTHKRSDERNACVRNGPGSRPLSSVSDCLQMRSKTHPEVPAPANGAETRMAFAELKTVRARGHADAMTRSSDLLSIPFYFISFRVRAHPTQKTPFNHVASEMCTASGMLPASSSMSISISFPLPLAPPPTPNDDDDTTAAAAAAPLPRRPCCSCPFPFPPPPPSPPPPAHWPAPWRARRPRPRRRGPRCGGG